MRLVGIQASLLLQGPAEQARAQHLAAAEAVTQEASAKMIGLPPDPEVGPPAVSILAAVTGRLVACTCPGQACRQMVLLALQMLLPPTRAISGRMR